jgi:hypothetical protein
VGALLDHVRGHYEALTTDAVARFFTGVLGG